MTRYWTHWWPTKILLPSIRDHIFSLLLFVVRHKDLFTENSDVHDLNTRFKHDLHLPSTNLTLVQRGVLHSGSKIFNHLHNIFGRSIVKIIFSPPLNTLHTSWSFWVFNFGCYLVSPVIELLDACHPSTLCSPMECAYFVNKSYINCILYDSSSAFLHVTCL